MISDEPARRDARDGAFGPASRACWMARALLVFAFGVFTIGAQSLLFREFITTFEGNDISVGIFFCSWFVWIGVGATLVNKVKGIGEALLGWIELLFLCYVPAFVVQFLLIVQARELAGIEPYELWTIRGMVLWSLAVNAPVSAVTGMLFPVACRWVRGDGASAVSGVYILEAAGSFVGGLGVTVLLAAGADATRIFFLLALVLCAGVLLVGLAGLRLEPRMSGRVALAISLVLVAGLGLSLATGADSGLSGWVRALKWSKLLPGGSLLGSFSTAQAEYLYGQYRGQWVTVREGSVCETVGDTTTAGRTAALSLCQNPRAESVLVIGSGLGLCGQFLRLPQTKRVTWAHPDPEYARLVDRHIRADLRISDDRFARLDGDIRAGLAASGTLYDIVVLDLPDATSSVLNRYYTLEFYRLLKATLRAGGVLAVRVTAGENIMGTELINLGASVKLTLAEVFAHFALVPGEQSWFIVSDSPGLTSEAARLRDRFASIEGAERIFSPEALLSVYLPQRAEAALERYSLADLPRELLVNRDSRPLAHLYSLLLAAKQSGAPVTRFVKHLAVTGPVVLLVPVLVFVILRLLYVLGARGTGASSGFDAALLVFSLGAVGIGTVIVLMYLYQTYFGSLYLHIGAISSLFMVGLAGGAALTRRVLRRTEARLGSAQFVLLLLVVAHVLLIVAAAFLPGRFWGQAPGAGRAVWQQGHVVFAVAFVLSGFCAGSYFPIAASWLGRMGFEPGRTGSVLATADHLGAAAGGAATSLVLVPVLGTRAALLVFVPVILGNLPGAAVAALKPEKLQRGRTLAETLRRAGYCMLAAGMVVVICSNLMAAAAGRLRPSLDRQTARALAGGLDIKAASARLEGTGKNVDYFAVFQADANAPEAPGSRGEPVGYIFSSADLAADVRGFGGRLNLAIYVDAAGRLVDFHVVRSNETPSYLELLGPWRKGLAGRGLFGPKPFEGVDTVSGATVSSEAILSALARSGRAFAAGILGLAVESQRGTVRPSRRYVPDVTAVYLLGGFAAAVLVTYLGRAWMRYAVLGLSLAIGGLALNAQYSSEQIATLLSLHAPPPALAGAFLMVVGIPVLTVLLGNHYCGYVCPFGAAQELLSCVLPDRFRRPLPVDTMRKARFLKYVILLVLVVAFFISRDRATLSADPLITVFGLRASWPHVRWAALEAARSLKWLLGMILVASVLYRRFWCRYLCPAGAFLSLFNRFAPLKRFLPARRFGRCEFGLTGADSLDCIYCDRCRHRAKAASGPARLARAGEGQAGPAGRYLVVAAAAAAILVSSVTIATLARAIPSSQEYSAAFTASGGQPRQVDMRRLLKLIEQNKLSSREAEFYKKLD